MMKKLGAVVLLALSYSAMPGCGGITKQELDSVKAELLAHDEQVKSSLKTELTGIDQKYVTVQQLQMKVEKQLEEMTKLKNDLTELSKSLDMRANVATGNALKAPKSEE